MDARLYAATLPFRAVQSLRKGMVITSFSLIRMIFSK